MEVLRQMNIAQKLGFIRDTALDIVSNVEEKHRKLSDLLLLCSDPKDIDVVIKAIKSLSEVFCDIIPSYRIREQKTDVTETEGKGKTQKVSKEVKTMREFEQHMLQSYREYLKILEVFSKTKPEKMIKKQAIDDAQKRIKALQIYKKLREISFQCFCALLKKHPHFNYRLNIL